MAGENLEQGVRFGEWLTIAAVLVGPILAVQAQKLVEAGQAKKTMKEGIFRKLMATRAARLSTDHVQALNMIDIAFYGRKILGYHFQSKSERQVRRKWKEYFDSLNTPTANFSPAQQESHFALQGEKFIALLESMALAQNYDFDSVDLKNSAYNPIAHGQLEAEQDAIRKNLAMVLKGESALKIDITNSEG